MKQRKLTNCLQCGSGLMMKKSDAMFCSRKCGERFRNPPKPTIIKDCMMCGLPFSTKNGKFCSDRCCDKHHHILDRRRRNAARKPKIRQQIQKTCRICSQAFSTIHPTHLFCSKRCKNRSAKIKTRIRDKGKKKSPHVRVKDRLSSRLRELLHRKGQQKKNSISAYMGCTPKEMVAHVERQFTKGMSWENYGVFGWHLDHIIPCQRFDLTNEDHCRVCFNWRNIRPLWGEHNWNRQEMLTLDEALQIDPVLVEMAKEVGVRLW